MGTTEVISGVNSFKIFENKGREYLLYFLKNQERELMVRNLESLKQEAYKDVVNYFCNDHGKGILLLQDKLPADSNKTCQLNLLNIETDAVTAIWEGRNAESVIFDLNCTQLVFSVEENRNDSKYCTLWYYKEGMDKATALTNSEICERDKGLIFDKSSIQCFSKDGDRIFLKLRKRKTEIQDPNLIKLDIWSYADNKLQSLQLKELSVKSYMAVIRIKDKRLIRLEQENDQIRSLFELNNKSDQDFILVFNTKGDPRERFWNISGQPSV